MVARHCPDQQKQITIARISRLCLPLRIAKRKIHFLARVPLLRSTSDEERESLVMLRKLLIAGLLVLMFTFTASAYTLVFRDGRRIDISSEFTVTRTTVTFEVSPGFNQTVLLTIVDIPATERANNESAGGFCKHRPEDQCQPAAEPAGRAR